MDTSRLLYVVVRGRRFDYSDLTRRKRRNLRWYTRTYSLHYDKLLEIAAQLERYLWAAATTLRGTIDAGDYKQDIFPPLFFKRSCDVYDKEYRARSPKATAT